MKLPNPDKDDILNHVQHLKDEQRAKSFREATITDMRAAFSKMEKEGWKTKKGEVKEYSSWTDKKFKDVIKKFYKVVFGNNEDYPEVVR